MAAFLFLALALWWGGATASHAGVQGLESAKGLHAEAHAAFAEGDYETAFEKWRKAAQNGDVLAQYNLAVLYHQGIGVEQNFGEAAKWYTRAAEISIHRDALAIAQNNLAVLYQKGQGVPQDVHAAVRWYERAVVAGSSEAAFNLGQIFLGGHGVPRDLGKAAEMFRQAAKLGDPDASHLLSTLTR